MQLPIQITFRNMKSSEAVEARIREEAAKLEKFYDRLISCRVMVEMPHRHQQQGIPFHIRIDLGVPNGEIVVKHEPSLHATVRKTEVINRTKKQFTEAPRKDIYVAIHDAFKTARRQLQQFARKQSGSIKQHEATPTAQVSKLVPDKDYGFLVTPEGEEVYFHRNSVLNDAFEQLAIGSPVTYVEVHGEKGLQASTVKMQRPALRTRSRSTTEA